MSGGTWSAGLERSRVKNAPCEWDHYPPGKVADGLVEIWNREPDEEEDDEPLVVIHKNHRHHRSYSYEGIEAVLDYYRQQPKSREITSGTGERVIRISCPNKKNHERGDLTPSAGIFVTSGAGNCFKCGPFKPEEMASYAGVQLKVVEDEEEEASDNYTDVSEARTQLVQEMSDAIDGDGGVHVFSVPVGIGKSYTARRCLDARPDQDWSILVDSHRQGADHAEDLSGALHLDKPWKLESRCISEPMDDRGEAPTRKGEILLRDALGEPRASVCATCPLNPDSDQFDDSRDPCAFIERKKAVKAGDDNAILAKNYIRSQTAIQGVHSGRDGVILDEDSVDHLMPVLVFDLAKIRTLLDRAEKVPVKTFNHDADIITRATANEDGSDLEDVEYMPIGTVVKSIIEKETLPHWESSTTTGRIIEHWHETAEWGDGDDARIRQTVTEIADEDGRLGLQKLQVNEEATRFLNALKNQTITDCRIVEDHEGNETLMLRCQSDAVDLDNIIILDASLTELDRVCYRTLFAGRDLTFHEIHCHNPDSTLIQDPSCSYSEKSQNRNLNRHDDQSFEGMDRYARLRQFVSKRLEEVGAGNIGVISQKGAPIVSRLLNDLDDLEEADVMHYGDVRGHDDFNGRDLIIIGDPSVNGIAYEIEKFRYLVPKEAELISFGNPIHSPDGSYTRFYDGLHPVEPPEEANLDLGEQIFCRLIRTEIYQAVGRARPLTNDVTVYYFGGPQPSIHALRQMTYVTEHDKRWEGRQFI